jgi:hypothetical protein
MELSSIKTNLDLKLGTSRLVRYGLLAVVPRLS